MRYSRKKCYKMYKIRKYAKRLLNFIFNSYHELIIPWKFVVELGILLSNNYYVVVIFEKRKVDKYDIDEYKFFFINRIKEFL